ncbi:MAG: hypothetical protein MJZ22_04675, partial [Candidatus Saccharibacteria bacterium]|nr:hypothetical protein [Candidatus Saccharibacteria bacterium]
MMFGKNDAERVFAKYGFNSSLKNDETIEKTAKAFSKNEYTVANGPKGRNRLNSGILRNQFILLLDSLNGRTLNDYTFSGVSLLHDDQYVLVHQNENSDVWEAYQGNTPNSPRKVYDAITLQNFFDEVVKTKEKKNSFIFEFPKNEKSVGDRKTDFIFWLSRNCKGKTEFQKHVVCVLEKWLDAKIPNANIGNLFRFEKSADYEIEKNRISAMPTWDTVNEKDSNGRPRTALNHYLNFLKEFEREEPNTSSPRQQNPSFTPAQIIYYGVPGCGKSNKIKQDFENGNVDEEAQVVRCVFHPEYTNADFVGQIFPVVKKDGKGVDYKFKPGPFTEILRRAYLNPHREFFLVIEEINRGNAAAIFGEMFQLLDRIKEGKDKSGFGPGWSSYSILNDDLNDYIRNIEAFNKFEHVGCVKPNLYKDMRDGNGNVVDAPDENGKKEIDFSTATSYSSLELTLQGFDVPQIFRESTSIRLPPNLSILATMNTSDQ